jgi:hypothetical protein
MANPLPIGRPAARVSAKIGRENLFWVSSRIEARPAVHGECTLQAPAPQTRAQAESGITQDNAYSAILALRARSVAALS